MAERVVSRLPEGGGFSIRLVGPRGAGGLRFRADPAYAKRLAQDLLAVIDAADRDALLRRACAEAGLRCMTAEEAEIRHIALHVLAESRVIDLLIDGYAQTFDKANALIRRAKDALRGEAPADA